MSTIEQLFKNNLFWSDSIKLKSPEYFTKLRERQDPDFLWIGCSDSRVPAEYLTGLNSGELFVHRNIANQIIHTDLNCLSVIQYAVDILQVKHIIVCGHYDCGGISAAIKNAPLELMNQWLLNIRHMFLKRKSWFSDVRKEKWTDKLCEINLAEQVYSLGNLAVMQNAWKRNQDVEIHGVIYNISDGKLEATGMHCSSIESLRVSYKTVMSKILSDRKKIYS
ncbi:carbonic anhydrase [Candidatus Photodesmus blepharus]|uniref:Carbonic anhydrase n=1 Tax=Candidatus Photodesmus blepharonis TaxID=1179155 RepID=A0A084CP49_9GAMM|nr:carbonate dehydratase [Candidatus Photodesmus blepharus]KEY91578.1 carbonic anhydrase [Candidatus Photodesmus blepharus]